MRPRKGTGVALKGIVVWGQILGVHQTMGCYCQILKRGRSNSRSFVLGLSLLPFNVLRGWVVTIC